jgi:starch phosphorylase
MRHGWQFERPDEWDWHRYPWLIGRFDEMVWIPMYGHVEHSVDREGRYNPMWMDWQLVAGVPYDLPVIGADGETVQFLRLYSARSSNDFDMQIFNVGDYLRAVQQKIESETISRVLYPADEVPQGRELRLLQEYFLVACAVRDIMRRYLRDNATLDKLAERVALQMNDTHPTLAVAELMRTLIDEHGVEWDQAWEWTRAICGYTNHTLMAEALETWPVELLEKVLPRHLQIIYEINDRFLQQVRERWPGDEERVQRMSLIGESGGKRVRMAHLAIVGSHAVNGVSALHSRLVAESLVPDFAALWPERFQNKTNGVTHRRWLKEINPPLAALLTDAIGEAWVREPQQLERLASLANDPALGERFLACKLEAKTRLADYVRTSLSLRLDPASLFDIQIKRIHPIQAPASEYPLGDLRVSANLRGRLDTRRRADLPIRGQSGAELSHGEADHAPDLRRLADHSGGPARTAVSGRCISSRLSSFARRAHDSRRRYQRADLDRRHGGVRYRQHETVAQRSADHWHLRWSEHRDPGTRGREELLSVRSHHRGGS